MTKQSPRHSTQTSDGRNRHGDLAAPAESRPIDAACPPGPSAGRLAETLRQAIVVGELGPGSRLTEAALEARHGASREAARDALHMLERRGLVTREPRRGWRVRTHDETSIRQLYEVRSLLERHAVAGLLNGEPDLEALIGELMAANAAMEARRQAGDPQGYRKANDQFHAVILRHAPNEALRLAIEQINDVAAPLRHAMLASDLADNGAVEEHAAIIEMMQAGQMDAAVDAMADHILGNADAVVRAMAA